MAHPRTSSVGRFLLRRTLQAIPLLFGVLTLVFFLSRLLPGDAATLYRSPTVSAESANRLRSQFGLDKPLAVQYLRWMAEMSRGNLGLSTAYNSPVAEILGRVFPNTLLLGCPALLAEVALALLLVFAAKHRPGSVLDRWMARASLVVYALPTFWVGLVLMTVCSHAIGLLPSSGMLEAGASLAWDPRSIADLLRHLPLPVLTLALPGAAGLARVLASAAGNAEKQEFVLAATAMGLGRGAVLRRYILPNSLGPMIAMTGMEIGSLMTGVLVTETLFAWPGMGRLIVVSVFARDYPLMLGCTLLGGCIVIAGNLMADLAQAVLDPRVRIQ